MNNRPPDATQDALRMCLEWLDACRRLGWPEAMMGEIESFFWQHRDREGKWKKVADARSLKGKG